MKYIKLPVVIDKTTMSKSQIWDMVKENIFPQPITLSERRVAWDLEEVEEWMKKKKEESRSKASTGEAK